MTDKPKIIVFGCGGHARSVVNAIREEDEAIQIILVDANADKGEVILGCKAESTYELKAGDHYIIAIGNNEERQRLYEKLEKTSAGQCISVISAHAQIGCEAQIGRGAFIASNAYLGPQAVIGENTIINTGSIIEHETRIGNHTHIAPHATICGRVSVGNHVFCGAGSTIIDHISICDHVGQAPL